MIASAEQWARAVRPTIVPVLRCEFFGRASLPLRRAGHQMRPDDGSPLLHLRSKRRAQRIVILPPRHGIVSEFMREHGQLAEQRPNILIVYTSLLYIDDRLNFTALQTILIHGPAFLVPP